MKGIDIGKQTLSLQTNGDTSVDKTTALGINKVPDR